MRTVGYMKKYKIFTEYASFSLSINFGKNFKLLSARTGHCNK